MTTTSAVAREMATTVPLGELRPAPTPSDHLLVLATLAILAMERLALVILALPPPLAFFFSCLIFPFQQTSMSA